MFMISEDIKKQLREKYICTGCWGNDTFAEMLKKISEQYGTKIAAKDEQMEISFRQWNELAEQYAVFFYQEGLREGDKVVLQFPNSVMFLIICFAMFKLGVVPVLALPAHREHEISAFIEKTNAKAYIVPKRHLGYDYTEMAEICIKNTCCKVYYEENLSDMDMTGKMPVLWELSVSSYDTAVLLVSGGTTGIPKLIPRTHADYLYDASLFAKVVGMNENTVFLASIPVAHNFTFANPGVIGTAMNGGKIILSRNGSADEILDYIETEGVTITSLVPSLLAITAQIAELYDPEQLSSLKTVLVGGAVLPPDVLELAEKNLHCHVRQVFGTAEGMNSITPEDMPLEQIPDCQGLPISEYDECIIVDEDDRELSPNSYGELLIRGPYTIMNYYENPEADKESFRADGFYRTGDKAFIDENGCIHVCGRMKEQINKSGEKITPSEIETILREHEQILDVAVFAIPDNTVGNRICAGIVQNRPIAETELRDFMIEKGLALYKIPDDIFPVDAIPLTAVGKADKKKLLDMFQKRCANV